MTPISEYTQPSYNFSRIETELREYIVRHPEEKDVQYMLKDLLEDEGRNLETEEFIKFNLYFNTANFYIQEYNPCISKFSLRNLYTFEKYLIYFQ